MMTEPFFSPLIGFPLSAKEKKKKKIDWIDSRHLLAIVCVCVCVYSFIKRGGGRRDIDKPFVVGLGRNIGHQLFESCLVYDATGLSWSKFYS